MLLRNLSMKNRFGNTDGEEMQLLQSDKEEIFLRPYSHQCVGGIYSCYDPTYPPKLKGIINKPEFDKLIDDINDCLTQYWPCCICASFGYICCPFTCGLSCFCPNLCVSQAIHTARRRIENVNERWRKRGVHFALRESRPFTSKIVITIARENHLPAVNDV